MKLDIPQHFFGTLFLQLFCSLLSEFCPSERIQAFSEADKYCLSLLNNVQFTSSKVEMWRSTEACYGLFSQYSYILKIYGFGFISIYFSVLAKLLPVMLVWYWLDSRIGPWVVLRSIMISQVVPTMKNKVIFNIQKLCVTYFLINVFRTSLDFLLMYYI